MRTLFLGSYGFGNLGDELCLIDAVRKFQPTEAWAFSSNERFTRRMTGVDRYITDRPQIAEVKPERIVLGGGGVGFWPSLRDSLHWMRDGMIEGAELHIHNIGVGKIDNTAWFEDEIVKRVIANLSSFTVRDHVSQWLVREWGFGVSPGITLYPEYSLAPEPFALPKMDGRLIGFSITGQRDMQNALEANRDKIRRFLAELGSFTAVPIVSTVQDDNDDENDIIGFQRFADMFLSGRKIALTEMLEPSWWNAEVTPLRLKYIISRLDLLVSQRKHNVIHAIGSNTRFIGIFPDIDDSILRIMFSLRHRVPAGSSFLCLNTDRYSTI